MYTKRIKDWTKTTIIRKIRNAFNYKVKVVFDNENECITISIKKHYTYKAERKLCELFDLNFNSIVYLTLEKKIIIHY